MQNELNDNSPYKKIVKPTSEKNNSQILENIFKTEYKINRVHRLSPQNLTDIPEEQNNLNFHYKTPSNKKKKRDIDEEIYKDEVNKEINKRKNIYKEFIKIYTEMKLLRRKNVEEEIQNSLNENKADKGKKEEIYFIINKTWFNQFRNYCAKNNLSYSNINEDYPGQINNQHLILKDDACLKLHNENKIIINTKYLDNCVLITENMWQFLVGICGGGPEIKYILNKNNETTVKKPVHINLIFLPKKQIISNNNNKEPSDNISNPLNPFLSHDIKKILKNIDNNNKIRIEKIYFDSSKNVKELINYINQILNQNKNKFTNTPIFFGPSFTLEENKNIENVNYRLWLLILNNKIEITTLSNIIEEYIYKNEDVDFPLNFPQLNNNLNNIYFHPYLLTNFLSNKVFDIFPNKYGKNFNHKDYNKIEDENTMPEINILIEEFPYHFQEPKKEYTVKKCSQCHYKDYVFSACSCGKAFYCSDECKKRNVNSHLISCNISLFNYLVQKNENLYRTIKGRKDFFEKENINILGLTNLGNSCYMNSSLQCLFATKELTNFFLFNFSNEYINKENILGSGGLLTLGYINLLLNINNTTNNRYISPESFKIILGKCSAKFEGNEQEDAHEFISYLLDVFHEDLNRVKEKPNNSNLIPYKNKHISEEDKSIIDWNNFLKRNQSVLIDLFYGQLKSCVTCPNCNYDSINFNSFLSLELSINQNKNYHIINIEFIDYYKESPNINFTIVLYNKENKVYHLRKKISNLLDIDLLSFELGIVYDNKIIHIYDLNDEINNTIISIVAYRINPEFFYSEKNGRYIELLREENINVNNNNINSLYNKYKIDFTNLEQNVYKRKNDIIKFNQSDNDSINKDLLSFSLLYHNNIGLDNSFFHRFILENFLMRKGSAKNLDKDEIIYLEKEKTCKEIYYEIFKKNVLNVIVQNIHGEERNTFIELYNSNDIEEINNEIKKKFEIFFKEEIINELRPSKLSIKNNFPDCPFILILKNEKYNIYKIIPFSPNINFQELLNKYKEEIEIKKNNNNLIIIPQNEKEVKNNYILFDDLMNEIIKENNNNKNKKNPEKNDGLKGGEGGGMGGGGSDDSSESDNENEENSEETDNNENNENNIYDNEYSNSERDINSLNEGTIGSKSLKSLSSGYDINTPSTSPIKNIKLKDEEKMLLFKLKTEKDENTDRIIVIWNIKYIKELGKYPDINLYDICDKFYETSTNQGIKLEKLFEEYSKEEKLDKENKYKCENCKEELEANKKIEIYHIPKILIIHLKRFNNNKKINTFIEFPLTDLNINPFIKSSDTVSKYDLFGVINHFGSLEYGHYTSFCLNYKDNNWYEYNDRIANKIQKGKEKDAVINKNAYILFYRAKDNDDIDWNYIYNKQFEFIDENNLKKYGGDFVYNKQEENKIIIEDNNIQKKEEEIAEDKNEFIILDENDDNFSFKEGMNNRTISNIENTNDENDVNNSSRETPKFKNKTELIEGDNNLINFNLNETNEINKTNEIKEEPKECKTENKKTDIFNGVKITSANTFKILTYMKPRKKEIKDNNKSDKTDKTDNELLQYNIFNQSRKYFNLNQKKIKKGINSVKNKELSLFLLKEISDNKTNKVPRSKKLYDEIENKINTEKEEINNDKNNIKEKEKENIIEINTKINGMNLNDYVYNPFKNCYLKLKKF